MSVSLRCCIVIEELGEDKCSVKRRISLKNSNLTAVRDDSSRIVLRVTPLENTRNKSIIKSLGFPVVEVMLYKRFIEFGRATICLPLYPARLMLSNCPPDQLRVFLITLRAKLKAIKPARPDRLPTLHGPPTSLSLLEEISPLRSPTTSQPRSKISSPNVSSISPKEFLQVCESSPIGDSNPSRSGPLLISTPVRKTKKVIKAPVERTFSHVVSSWHGSSTPSQSKKQGNHDLQLQVVDLVKKGRNVFCTGGAGTGKSHLIRRIIGILPPDCTAVTASTGTAANLIGGTTVHAFSGVGNLLSVESQNMDENGSEQLDGWLTAVQRRIAASPLIVNRWQRVKHLIIDEISMLSSVVFQRLDLIARATRLKDGIADTNGPAFGGIQLIVFGDFYQLPPVTKSPGMRFAFETPTWKQCRFSCVELTHSWRQSDDPDLTRVLSVIREGNCPEWAKQLLKSRFLPQTIDHQVQSGAKSGLIPTRLCTHRGDAELWNAKMLNALTTPPKVYRAQDSNQSQSRLLDSICPAPSTLTLKVGAQVVLLRNIDTGRGLVNGVRGVVERLNVNDQLPQVRFFVQRSTEPGAKTQGLLHTVQLERWNLRGDGRQITAYRRQLPLNLAWAISIHKSQGITLDSAELVLSKVFECGQAYVALSRCRSLSGLRLLDWRPEVIQADPKVKEFYANIRRTNVTVCRREALFSENTSPIKRIRIS